MNGVKYVTSLEVRTGLILVKAKGHPWKRLKSKGLGRC
jgi:hypothetical protein